MNGKAWTAEHTNILFRMAGKYTDEEIATVTGHWRETVTRQRRAKGLPACHRIDWTRRSWARGDAIPTPEGSRGDARRAQRTAPTPPR
jgi:hypothetical protein